MNKTLFCILWIYFLLNLFIMGCTSQDASAYENFIERAQAEESYIGFFAAEEKCITESNDAYLSARQAFLLGVDTCEEDPEEFIEPFIDFCKTNSLIKDGCEEEWETTLTVLSYELYANKPIFEYSSQNLIEHRNLVFAEYSNKKLELDLFLPEKSPSEPFPCIVCVHGGGWRVNRRVWFEPFARYLADRGFAAVTIDYRMLPAVTIKECVFDAKAAVRWVRANAKKYNVDPDRIGTIGASAGAQMVALLGTTGDVPELEGSGGNPGYSSAVQAVVGIATPSFRISTNQRWFERFGISVDELRLLSPYENISSDSAPLYLIHGDADQVVPPANSQELYDKYKEVGVQVELTWIPGEGHGFYEGNDRGIALATEFFKKVLLEK